VKRLDALFDIERAINGRPAAERLAVRQELSAPLMAELHTWLTDQRAKLSRNHDLTKACLYMLRRWEAFTRFLEDGRVCLSNNAAERALRCVPISGSFCPCWARRGNSLPLASVFRPSASLREQRRPCARAHRPSGGRTRARYHCSGMDDRPRRLRDNGTWLSTSIACSVA